MYLWTLRSLEDFSLDPLTVIWKIATTRFQAPFPQHCGSLGVDHSSSRSPYVPAPRAQWGITYQTKKRRAVAKQYPYKLCDINYIAVANDYYRNLRASAK